MVSTGAKNPTDKSHNHETQEDEDDDGRVGGGGDGEMEEKPQGNNNNGEAFGLGPELLLFISLPLAQDNNVGPTTTRGRANVLRRRRRKL